MGLAWAGRFGPALPHPFHNLWKNLGGTLYAVIAVAPIVAGIITCKIERRGKHAIALVPVPKQWIPHVVGAVLKENPEWTWLALAHNCLKVVTAAHRHKGAYTAEHSAKSVWMMPSRRECRYAATAQAKDHAVGATSRQLYRIALCRCQPFYLRQQFCLKKGHELFGGHVKLVAAIVAQHAAVVVFNHTWLDKHANGHRHLAHSNQAVHHIGGIAQNAVEPNIEARRLLAVVGFGNIYLHVALGARIISIGTFKMELYYLMSTSADDCQHHCRNR